jgi:hypothetical protein
MVGSEALAICGLKGCQLQGDGFREAKYEGVTVEKCGVISKEI